MMREIGTRWPRLKVLSSLTPRCLACSHCVKVSWFKYGCVSLVSRCWVLGVMIPSVFRWSPLWNATGRQLAATAAQWCRPDRPVELAVHVEGRRCRLFARTIEALRDQPFQHRPRRRTPCGFRGPFVRRSRDALPPFAILPRLEIHDGPCLVRVGS